MKHYDEYTLELYVLNAPEAAGQRSEIDDHLADCHGCRAIVDELRTFYGQLDHELNEVEQPDSVPQQALVPLGWKDRFLPVTRKKAELEKLFETYPYYRPSNLVRQFQNLVRWHPVVAGEGSFVTASAIAAALFFGAKDFFKDTNPAYTVSNVSTNTVDVYNKENETLWSFQAGTSLANCRERELWHLVKFTATADIDGDGTNEVITTVDSASETPDERTQLRVFDANGHLRWARSFTTPFQYFDRTYDPTFFGQSFVVLDSKKGSEKQIVCAATNLRSPSYIARIDANNEVIGEYWHFGYLSINYIIDLNRDGKQEIIALGTNDLADSTHGEFGVIVVLDPAKITGRKSATIVDGFGLPKSDAELYYIRIPSTDLSQFEHQRLDPGRVQDLDDGSLLITSSNLGDKGERKTSPELYYEYRFSPDMNVMTVKSGDVTNVWHDRLVDEGKLLHRADETYFENLKNAVRYWDGHEWCKEVTMVQHPTVADGHQPVTNNPQ